MADIQLIVKEIEKLTENCLRPIQIFVYRSRVGQGESYVAHCIQYSGVARGEGVDQYGAVVALVNNLFNFLVSCKNDHLSPYSFCQDSMHFGFDSGTTVILPEPWVDSPLFQIRTTDRI
jgi:hypothetical protein